MRVYTATIIILIICFSCKNSEKSNIKIESNYELLENKSLTRGHYSPYFIIEGSKTIVRINKGNEEILIESNMISEQNIIDDSNLKDYKILIIKGHDEYYKVIEGVCELNFIKSNKLEIKMGVKANTNVWLQEEAEGKEDEVLIEYTLQEVIYIKEEVQ